MAQLKVLMDAKLSLELEITQYRALLELEENRTSSSMKSVSMSASSASMSAVSASQSSQVMQASSSERSSQSAGKVTIQRSCKGAIGFLSIEHSGANVVIECDQIHPNAKDYNLTAGDTYTIWAKGAKQQASASNEMIADAFSFGTGTCTWQLFDASGLEKATLNATVVVG